jgi:uridylate kinase
MPIDAMKTICISLGGSVISRNEGYNFAYLKGFSGIIERHKESKFVIVTGGGAVSRMLVSSAKSHVNNNYALDQIGIMVTRVNALVLSEIISGAIFVEDIKDAKTALLGGNIAVMGGLLPGITTDAVTVLACEALQSRLLINVSSDGYLYSKNPRYGNAKPIKKADYDLLINRANEEDARLPGTNFIFDSIAGKLAKRSGIVLKFVDENLAELEKAINGKSHNGTTIG